MDTIHPMYFQHRLVKYHVDIEFQVLQRLHVNYFVINYIRYTGYIKKEERKTKVSKYVNKRNKKKIATQNKKK